MKGTTNQRISHTIYPDGLRIDYDYVQDEQSFIPTIQKKKLSRKENIAILILSIIFIYLLF